MSPNNFILVKRYHPLFFIFMKRSPSAIETDIRICWWPICYNYEKLSVHHANDKELKLADDSKNFIFKKCFLAEVKGENTCSSCCFHEVTLKPRSSTLGKLLSDYRDIWFNSFRNFVKYVLLVNHLNIMHYLRYKTWVPDLVLCRIWWFISSYFQCFVIRFWS